MGKDSKNGNGIHKKLEFLFEYGVDTEKRIIYFNDDVEQHSVDRIIKALSFFENTPNRPVSLSICSYGGSMDQMFALYDAIVTTPTKSIGVGNPATLMSQAKAFQAMEDRAWMLLERHSTWSARKWKESAQKKGEVWLTPSQMLKAGVIDGIRAKNKPPMPIKKKKK